jgi:hypothetical protein
MSTIREMAEEVSRRLGEEVDFFLVLKPKQPDPATGLKKSVVATNVVRALPCDVVVDGTNAVIMDQLLGVCHGKAEG